MYRVMGDISVSGYGRYQCSKLLEISVYRMVDMDMDTDISRRSMI